MVDEDENKKLRACLEYIYEVLMHDVNHVRSRSKGGMTVGMPRLLNSPQQMEREAKHIRSVLDEETL